MNKKLEERDADNYFLKYRIIMDAIILDCVFYILYLD